MPRPRPLRPPLVVGAAVVLVCWAGGCAQDEPVDQMRERIAERAADPAYALTTTVPGSAAVLDDPAVSFHTGTEVSDDEFERIRRGVLLARLEVGFDGPLDVYVDDGMASSPGGWDQGRGSVFLDTATPVDLLLDGRNRFVTAASSTVVVAQAAWLTSPTLPGRSAGESPAHRTPSWLRAGHAELVAWELASAHGELDVPWFEQRDRLVAAALAHPHPLDDEGAEDPGGRLALRYLAAERLAPRVDRASFDRYLWEQIASLGPDDGFLAVFGISVDEFLPEFEAWRAEGFPAA